MWFQAFGVRAIEGQDEARVYPAANKSIQQVGGWRWDSGKCCQHNLLMPSAKVLGKGAGDGFRLGRATGSLI